jgi:hypothetical protein
MVIETDRGLRQWIIASSHTTVLPPHREVQSYNNILLHSSPRGSHFLLYIPGPTCCFISQKLLVSIYQQWQVILPQDLAWRAPGILGIQWVKRSWSKSWSPMWRSHTKS